MIRPQIISLLRELMLTLGPAADGTQWHLFGSVDRNEADAADIDLMILCKTDAQADALRRLIDTDALPLPLHLSLLTFEEDAEIGATKRQRSSKVSP